MIPMVVGQRCVSEREPELGMGTVVSAAHGRLGVRFPLAGEERLYALESAPVRRVVFREGETIVTRDGRKVEVMAVEEESGLRVYLGGADERVREDEISEEARMDEPRERLLRGQTSPASDFNLRRKALELQWQYRSSPVRGFVGGRLELIPHQFHIAAEVSARPLPRVLLADEVGLGKTIEACLILQRLLLVGKVRRALVIVPESLVHQWFVELLRRFNLWFSIYDEARCEASGRGGEDENPFLDEQLVLCSVSFLAGDELRGTQAVEAGWDLLVVDEAHHLEWREGEASDAYQLVERLAENTPGVLLLTATPTQLGPEGHFARLKLLDPDRYVDFAAFEAEARSYGQVATAVDRILSETPLQPSDEVPLRQLAGPAGDEMERHLEGLRSGLPGARNALIRFLLDAHGTGRVIFRNRRAHMSGFPERRLCAVEMEGDAAGVTRSWRELLAEEQAASSAIRYSYRKDPRIDWLVKLLSEEREEKFLLICRSERKVHALEAALRERTSAPVAVFHEGMPLVQRDRNAAWFAEPEGARLLISSEIGGEGRNFQFSHHLLLWDLPLNPGLIEQRIGRLDRIGQRETIRIHVPYLKGSAEEQVLAWYDRGLSLFAEPLHGSESYLAHFRPRLLALLEAGERGPQEAWNALVEETAAFRKTTNEEMRRGRDRLLELNSFDEQNAAGILEQVRQVDADEAWKDWLLDLFERFGVRVREHEEGDLFIDASHSVVEGFPGVPREGLLATTRRSRAIAREDKAFLSLDHPLVRDSVDLLLNSEIGTASFGTLPGEAFNVLLEAHFVLEPVADSRWHVELFLAPTPLRIVVDLQGRLTDAEPAVFEMLEGVEDASFESLGEGVREAGNLLKSLLERAEERAEAQGRAIREKAAVAARERLEGDLERLLYLREINPNVRASEVDHARERLQSTLGAIVSAGLRLDSLRMVLVEPEPSA